MVTQVRPYAGYRQFYLSSDRRNPGIAEPEFWTEEASRERLAVAPFTLAIGTDTYGEVPVDVEVLDSASQLSIDDWDHVVEASFEVTSGVIEVSGCPDSEMSARIEVEPGIYIVRVFCRGLSEAPDDSGTYSGDSYLIQLWRSEHRKRTVLKRFDRI
jgi:hypothetical protein